MQWFYIINEQQHGPVTEAEMRGLIAEGVVASTDYVWHEGLGDEWVTAGSLVHQFADQPEPPPVPVPEEGIVEAPVFSGDTPNADLMQHARSALKGNWGIADGALLIHFASLKVLGSIDHVGGLFFIAVEGPFRVGLALIFLRIVRGGEAPGINLLFKGFQQVVTAICAYLLKFLFISLWSLLLIVPGILAAFSYTMTYYVIADHPGIGPLEAIARSKAMMYGRRLKLMDLYCRFLGWFLLALLTCGIGFIFLIPYFRAAHGAFYEDIRNAPPITKT